MIDLPRVQAFELHDLPQCPTFVRETIVESLGNALRWSRAYDAVAPVFAEFVERSGADSVLDLCSGTGEPVGILLDALQRSGRPLPRVSLSDLYPNRARLEGVAARFEGFVDVADRPVDASDVPFEFAHGARTIISAFHHFPPELATRILADAVEQRRALFVLEPASRGPLSGLGLAPWLALAMLANPFTAPRGSLVKFAATYLAPIGTLAMAWDSAVSLLRMYTREELLGMAGAAPDYHWEYRTIAARPGIRVSVFMGWPEP